MPFPSFLKSLLVKATRPAHKLCLFQGATHYVGYVLPWGHSCLAAGTSIQVQLPGEGAAHALSIPIHPGLAALTTRGGRAHSRYLRSHGPGTVYGAEDVRWAPGVNSRQGKPEMRLRGSSGLGAAEMRGKSRLLQSALYRRDVWCSPPRRTKGVPREVGSKLK